MAALKFEVDTQILPVANPKTFSTLAISIYRTPLSVVINWFGRSLSNTVAN
jgi:hypothetical protein